jgi:hypothetical protein
VVKNKNIDLVRTGYLFKIEKGGCDIYKSKQITMTFRPGRKLVGKKETQKENQSLNLTRTGQKGKKLTCILFKRNKAQYRVWKGSNSIVF